MTKDDLKDSLPGLRKGTTVTIHYMDDEIHEGREVKEYRDCGVVLWTFTVTARRQIVLKGQEIVPYHFIKSISDDAPIKK